MEKKLNKENGLKIKQERRLENYKGMKLMKRDMKLKKNILMKMDKNKKELNKLKLKKIRMVLNM